MTAKLTAKGAVRQMFVRCAVLFAFVIAMTQAVTAQQFFGSIVGTVTDTSGAIIPGATVTIANKATGEKHTASSNGAGEYQFVDLLPSAYSVQVERANFKRYLRDTVTVTADSTVRVDAKLQVGAVTETVEVNLGQTVQIQTDSGTVSNKVEAQQMDELPLNGRNVMQLLNITPGVIPSSAVEQGATLAQNNGTSTNPLSWGGGSSVYAINGGDNEEFLNGAPINVLQGSNIGLMPTADSIQEFNIDTSVGDSSEGRATGGVINEVTKSGTNKFHGTAYEYFRNADLNANNFFNKQAGLATPKFNQNLYGFNLGLPVKKDKIFFFGSYEVNDSLTAAPTLSNEPTTAMMNGVFNGVGINGGYRPFTDPLGVCDIEPYTGQSVNGKTFAAGGSYIANLNVANGGLKPNTTCGDPTAAILKTFWAEQPNTTLSATNYAVNIPAGDRAPEMNARMDIIISPKQRLFAHTAWWAPLDKPIIPYPNPNVTSALPGGKPWGLGEAVGGFNSNLYIFGDTYTFNPKTVMDLRAVYLRFRYSMIPLNNTFDLSGLGGQWSTFNQYFPTGNKYLPAPSFGSGNAFHNLAPYQFPFNGFGTGGQGQIWDNYGLNGTITHVFGKHSVKAGFEARLMDMQVLHNGFNPGNPSFGVKYSGNGSTTGDEWAEFLMGDFVSVSFNGSYGGTEYNYYQAYFVQDTWQATRKLTINLGARWELPGGLYAKKNHGLLVLPNATDPYTGAHGTEALLASPLAPSSSSFPLKYDLIDPRIGFAYRLDNKTVVRGGFGLTTQAADEDAGGNGTAGAAINSQQLGWTNPTGGGQTPTALLANPIPASAIYVPPLFASKQNFLQILAQAAQTGGGVALNGTDINQRLPYFEQYNFAIQRQIGNSFQATVSYVGSHGVELRVGGFNGQGYDMIAPSTYTVSGSGSAETAVAAAGPFAGTSITSPVPTGGTITIPATTPFTQTFANGVFCSPNGSFCNSNWLVGQSLQPYPNYKSVQLTNLAYGNQHYNALQATTQWRIPGGGLIGSALTWAKTIDDTKNQQNYYNHRADKTPDGVPARLAININYPLPIGRGQRFLNVGNGAVSMIISGWAINDVTSFQHGGYLAITSNSQNKFQSNFGGGTTRASYIPSALGCNNQKVISGAAVPRLNQWFNTACFAGVGQSLGGNVYLGNFDFGNETANDRNLFAQGIDNSDFSLAKSTKIAERLNVQFRAETFNTFNRFQASAPASLAAGNPGFGKVTSQANNPRQIQLSLRVSY
jgi:muramidase (phage lysozyme)